MKIIESNKLQPEIALIISSYDGASDLWKVLEMNYINHFPIECDIFLISNQKRFSGNLFQNLNIGDEKSWSDSIRKALLKIPHPYIILTYDDLFIQKVNKEGIEATINHALEKKLNYCQLIPSSFSEKKKKSNTVQKKTNETKYGNATVFSIWNKEFLLNVLDESESAWEFETKGNLRILKSFGNIYFQKTTEDIKYFNAVIKGKFRRNFKKYITNYIGSRKQLSLFDEIIYRFKFNLIKILKKWNAL